VAAYAATPPNQPQRCFNVNFNILLKQFYCASVGK
jgi:hypothetical protein